MIYLFLFLTLALALAGIVEYWPPPQEKPSESSEHTATAGNRDVMDIVWSQ